MLRRHRWTSENSSFQSKAEIFYLMMVEELGILFFLKRVRESASGCLSVKAVVTRNFKKRKVGIVYHGI